MLNTISSRATFYDITGYLIPGVATIGLGILYVAAFLGPGSACFILGCISGNKLISSILIIAVGYIVGHLMNALSSAILEKSLCAKEFSAAKMWYRRVLHKSPTRAAAINDGVKEDFGISDEELTTFDMRIRMEELMPRTSITGMSFLSFYGMSRTICLLALLTIPAGIGLSIRILPCPNCCVVSILVTLALLAIAKLYKYQYIRFVEYYYDFLGSTLLFRVERKSLGNQDTIQKKEEIHV